jgi:drug/metabolite transporter (DMT)-like permease
MIRWLKKIAVFLAIMSLVFFVGGGPSDEPTGFGILLVALFAAAMVGGPASSAVAPGVQESAVSQRRDMDGAP